MHWRVYCAEYGYHPRRKQTVRSYMSYIAGIVMPIRYLMTEITIQRVVILELPAAR